MNTGPGGENDGSLMAARFNRRRQRLPLSPDQIRIVDEFVAGRLAGEAAAAAERLVRENALVAERVMERRLLQQAGSSPAPPRALTVKGPLRVDLRSNGRWRLLGCRGGLSALSGSLPRQWF